MRKIRAGFSSMFVFLRSRTVLCCSARPLRSRKGTNKILWGVTSALGTKDHHTRGAWKTGTRWRREDILSRTKTSVFSPTWSQTWMQGHLQALRPHLDCLNTSQFCSCWPGDRWPVCQVGIRATQPRFEWWPLAAHFLVYSRDFRWSGISSRSKYARRNNTRLRIHSIGVLSP